MNERPSRSLFSRGEWLTLVGMILTVVSAALVWGPSRTIDPALLPAAVLVKIQPALVNAYAMRYGAVTLGGTVVGLSVVCGALLLLEPVDRTKTALFCTHLACALAILVIALMHLGPYAGVALASVGSLVLVAGGLVRYR